MEQEQTKQVEKTPAQSALDKAQTHLAKCIAQGEKEINFYYKLDKDTLEALVDKSKHDILTHESPISGAYHTVKLKQ